jgi:hypothetical protein
MTTRRYLTSRTVKKMLADRINHNFPDFVNSFGREDEFRKLYEESKTASEEL